jgi:exodeoxyribonuclease III
VRIATFNINNVNKRLVILLDWMAANQPDVICLQELKAEERAFPLAAIEAAGYGAVWQGQRTWNGVAILARGATPVLPRRALPGDPGNYQARYIEAAVHGVLVASIYLPNGNPQPGPKFTYKLAWFDRLITHSAELKAAAIPVVLAGDYNVVPTEEDIWRGHHETGKRATPARPGQRISACSTMAGLTRYGPPIARDRSGPSGDIFVIAGQTIKACVSIISS